jgi:hypothetical protein
VGVSIDVACGKNLVLGLEALCYVACCDDFEHRCSDFREWESGEISSLHWDGSWETTGYVYGRNDKKETSFSQSLQSYVGILGCNSGSLTRRSR